MFLRISIALALAASLAAQTPCIPTSVKPGFTGGTPSAPVTAIDINGDGLEDAAWPSATAGFQFSFAGPGLQFGPVNSLGQYLAAKLGVGDFNGDGRPDLAVAGDYGVELWISTGSAPWFVLSDTVSVFRFVDLGVADMDGDGLSDLAVVGSNYVQFIRITTSGPVWRPIPPFQGERPTALSVSPARGSIPAGLALRTVTTGGSARLYVAYNSGSSNIPIYFPLGTSTPIAASSALLEAADLTGDGTPDYILKSAGLVNDVSVYYLDIFLTDQPFQVGGVYTPVVLRQSFQLRANIFDLRAADFDHDGKQDIIGVDLSGLFFMRGDGTGGFGPQISVATVLGGTVTPGAFRGAGTDLLVNSNRQIVPVGLGDLPISLTSSANPTTVGTPVTIRAAAAASCGTPSGVLNFRAGNSPAGSAGFAGRNAVSVNLSLPRGTHTITADYVPGSAADPYQRGSASLTQVISCATVLSQAQVQKSGLLYSRALNQWQQTVTVRIGGSTLMYGPLYLALTGLSNGVTVVGAGSSSGCAVKQGTPYIDMGVRPGTPLLPGASISTTLRFSGTGASTASFTPVVLSGLTP